MGSDSQSKDPRRAGVFEGRTLVVIMQILSLVSKGSSPIEYDRNGVLSIK